MRCRAYILRDVPEPLTSKRWEGLTFRQMQETPDFAQGLGAFTTVRYHPDGHVYCGTTAFDNDILYRFDRKARALECLNYDDVAERYEVKVHRSLEIDTDGKMFGGTAGLHDVPERENAPGGSLFVFDPKTDEIEKIGIPVEREYIQNIVFDPGRRKICGCTYPVPYFFCFDVETRETVCKHYTGSMPHRLAIDDAGLVWGTWGEGHTPTYLFAYNQDNNAFHFPRVPLPGLERTEPGQLDGIINGGDGFLYVGTVQGGLFRLDPSDPDKPELAFLGKPAAKWRMPAFVIGDDGLLYILAGGEYDVHIFSYDRAGKRFADLGRVVDEERNISCFMPHDLALTPDGMAYVGETDHPERSGYLWECEF